MSVGFIHNVCKDFSPEPEDVVMDSIFDQYERVIVESLITSFGLDFIVKDRHGGDVDTVHNVRQIGVDGEMVYKNHANEADYNNRGEYNSAEYHSHPNYRTKKHVARDKSRETGQAIEDEYTGGELRFLGKSKGADPNKNAELDHVISAKSIHDDKGRVLSELSGTDLANSPENLRFTNKALNASMGADEIPDYLEKHPELPQETKDKMTKFYNEAKAEYERKIAVAYYTSGKFAKDTAIAAGKVAGTMAVRQAVGFVFTEVWFAVKEEFVKLKGCFDMGNFFTAVGNGIKRGFETAMKKYKTLLSKLKEGAIAGALSSLSTTLCNIFLTTAKNVVRLIRQAWASLVQAAKVLFLNPDNLQFGERMRAAAKILATGASVIAGVAVNEAIGKTVIAGIPVIGDIIRTFCGTLVTGIMSCTLLYFLDRSEIINKLVRLLDNLPSVSKEVDYFRKQADYFEKYAAELMEIDLEKFHKETEVYCSIASDLENAKDETELNALLKKAYAKIGITLPWQGDFDAFMGNKNNQLAYV